MNLLNYRYIFIKNFDNFIWISSLSSEKCQNFIRKWSSSSSSNHRDDHHHFINSFNCSTSQFNKFSLPYQSLLLNNYYQSDTLKSMTTTTKIFDKRYLLNRMRMMMIIGNPNFMHGFCTLSSSSLSSSPSSTSETKIVAAKNSSSNHQPLTITIRLSISFSNGYFSIRFAQRECLFHFWSPIELALKMLQEELVSASKISAIHCTNIGSKTIKQQPSSIFVDSNVDNFFDQLLIEFDTDINNDNNPQSIPLRFDHIKFGRIEMVTEHSNDNDEIMMDDNTISSSSSSGSSGGESQSSTDSDSTIVNAEYIHHPNHPNYHPNHQQQPSPTAIKQRYRLAHLMPFGYALLGCDLDEIYFLGTGTGTVTIPSTTIDPNDNDNKQQQQRFSKTNIEKSLRIYFKLMDKTKNLKINMEQWHNQNPLDTQTMLLKQKTIDPNLFEQNELVVRLLLEFYTNYNNRSKCCYRQKSRRRQKCQNCYMFLQQEHQTLLERFQPLQQEFTELIDSARKESRRRFKFGGLFLLSAQLGFVGRLTYFEYSWDIMEPVTWIMTYTTMVGSFAYYIITSEEYVVPGVEKRMIAARFWKLAKSRQFDVKQYKQLKEEIKQLEKRIGKLRARF
ncbi:mitochondrial calcium uniporter isoform X2 [Dermatophagoides pteronyssinus]|uniref:mitochondrial calcium uniporter isoform X2 n=1 Tax=Dermatophagoides pteronyssinus TaxID=6956 RepID=UPI003F67964B